MYCDTIEFWLGTMGFKNESIFLWLLEEDRRKSRARALKVCERSSQQFEGTEQHTWLSRDEISGIEKGEKAAENTKLKQLMKEKVNLEAESLRLDEEINKLDIRARTFCERVIKQIKKNNMEKQYVVSQLRENIEKMETRLELGSAIQETKEENDKTQQEINKLRELINAVDSQFEEIALSNASTDYTSEKTDTHDGPPEPSNR
jgi:hypothetical protein